MYIYLDFTQIILANIFFNKYKIYPSIELYIPSSFNNFDLILFEELFKNRVIYKLNEEQNKNYTKINYLEQITSIIDKDPNINLENYYLKKQIITKYFEKKGKYIVLLINNLDIDFNQYINEINKFKDYKSFQNLIILGYKKNNEIQILNNHIIDLRVSIKDMNLNIWNQNIQILKYSEHIFYFDDIHSFLLSQIFGIKSTYLEKNEFKEIFLHLESLDHNLYIKYKKTDIDFLLNNILIVLLSYFL